MDDRRSANRKMPAKKPRLYDDESDNFALLMHEDHGGHVGGDALTRFIIHAYSPSTVKVGHAMSKGSLEKDTVEKLQILIDKVSELKRRIFRPKSNATKNGARSDGKKEAEISNESTSRSNFVDQRILISS